MNDLYLSTAIPYVNAAPHLGFALEAILADVLARHARLRGKSVSFVTGTDENSLKNVRAAEALGITPAELVATNAEHYRALDHVLGISPTEFVRTSVDPRHRATVLDLWRACAARGALFKKRYVGHYCVGCEAFLGATEIVNGACFEHLTVPERIEEENWFFRLGNYRDRIREAITSDRLRITPHTRKNEALRFLEGDELEVSVSRSRARARGWGIEVPDDPEQVIYVWFDALASYIAAVSESGWKSADRRLHVLGKGILRFHAALWPAILLAAGLPLPTDLAVHGYVTIRGEKIGKSRGNVIDPKELVATYGVDALRWFLLRHVGGTRDADVDRERIDLVYRTELADGLGNLVARTTALFRRAELAHVPALSLRGVDPLGEELLSRARLLERTIDEALEKLAPEDALRAIEDVVHRANQHLSETAPWVLVKERANATDPASRIATDARLRSVLHHAHATLEHVANALRPFLPETAAATLRALADPTCPAPILFPKTSIKEPCKAIPLHIS